MSNPVLPLNDAVNLIRMYLSDMGFDPDSVCIGWQKESTDSTDSNKNWFISAEGLYDVWVEGYDYIDCAEQIEEHRKHVLSVGVEAYHYSLALSEQGDEVDN